MSLGAKHEYGGRGNGIGCGLGMGAECVRGCLECGHLARVAAVGPLNLSGPFWPLLCPFASCGLRWGHLFLSISQLGGCPSLLPAQRY